MADVKPYNIEVDIMSEYCGRCFATTFGRLFCMMWHILAHISNGRCYCLMLWLMLLPYVSIVADVCAIVNNIGSHLIVSKLADVIALNLYFCGRCYCHGDWWNYHLRCFECWTYVGLIMCAKICHIIQNNLPNIVAKTSATVFRHNINLNVIWLNICHNTLCQYMCPKLEDTPTPIHHHGLE